MSKALETLATPVGITLSDKEVKYTYTEEQTNIIMKELRALDIIKKKGLSMNHLDLIRSSNSYKEYDLTYKQEVEKRNDLFKYEVEYSEYEYNNIKEIL